MLDNKWLHGRINHTLSIEGLADVLELGILMAIVHPVCKAPKNLYASGYSASDLLAGGFVRL